MAAGEDQPQAIVGDRAHLVLLVRLSPRCHGLERRQLGALVLEAALAADPVDRLVARGGHDPRGRVVGHPGRGPALKRDHERLLDRLLGEVEVPEDARQRGDRPAGLLPEQAVARKRSGLGQDCAAAAPDSLPALIAS